MRHAAESDQALVVALLVAIVDRRAGKEAAAVVLVGALRGDAHVGQPREAAVGGAREEDVGRKPGRVVVGEGRVAAGRIHGQPLIETVVSSGRLADSIGIVEETLRGRRVPVPGRGGVAGQAAVFQHR